MKQTEHQIQAAYFERVRWEAERDWRYRWIFAVPNGGKLPFKNVVRKGKIQRACPQAQKLVREGLTKGVWDVQIFLPSLAEKEEGKDRRFRVPCAWIEFKAGKNKPTDEQLEFGNYITRIGCRVLITNNWEDAWSFTKYYIDNSGWK